MRIQRSLLSSRRYRGVSQRTRRLTCETSLPVRKDRESTTVLKHPRDKVKLGSLHFSKPVIIRGCPLLLFDFIKTNSVLKPPDHKQV